MEFSIQTKGFTKNDKIRVGEAIKYRAKAMCPTDKGDLIASIDYNIDGDVIIIFATDESAEAMEFGLPPSILSPSEKGNITNWAKRHGIKNPKKTSKYIETHGIEVGTVDNPLHVIWQGRNNFRPFLRPAIYQVMYQANLNKILRGKKQDEIFG